MSSLLPSSSPCACGRQDPHGPYRSASPHANITFVALRERNLDALERIVDVSAPQSERYGKFLSQRELDELTAPAPADISTDGSKRACTITTDERRRLYRATVLRWRHLSHFLRRPCREAVAHGACGRLLTPT